ncbi:MAG: LOG family protein [Spirochaetia bacterium]|nr:LOG family protein [Spirochaetia bacterium]
MQNDKPKKAFENQEFLHSVESRPLRILSEYLFPFHSFDREGVTDTVVFFGSARLPSPEEVAAGAKHPFARYYDESRALAREITLWSERNAYPKGRNILVCTGGGPGIMEASNRGAHDVRGKSIGLNIELPMEQTANPYISRHLNFDFHYFFTRKFWFLYFARAAFFFPGGFGTMDELFETLTLQQTRTIKNAIPCFLFGREYWNRAVNFEFLAESELISKDDLKLFHVVDSVDEAMALLRPVLENAL